MRTYIARKPVGSGSDTRPSAEYSPLGTLKSSPYINTASQRNDEYVYTDISQSRQTFVPHGLDIHDTASISSNDVALVTPVESTNPHTPLSDPHTAEPYSHAPDFTMHTLHTPNYDTSRDSDTFSDHGLSEKAFSFTQSDDGDKYFARNSSYNDISSQYEFDKTSDAESFTSKRSHIARDLAPYSSSERRFPGSSPPGMTSAETSPSHGLRPHTVSQRGSSDFEKLSDDQLQSPIKPLNFIKPVPSPKEPSLSESSFEEPSLDEPSLKEPKPKEPSLKGPKPAEPKPTEPKPSLVHKHSNQSTKDANDQPKEKSNDTIKKVTPLQVNPISVNPASIAPTTSAPPKPVKPLDPVTQNPGPGSGSGPGLKSHVQPGPHVPYTPVLHAPPPVPAVPPTRTSSNTQRPSVPPLKMPIALNSSVPVPMGSVPLKLRERTPSSNDVNPSPISMHMQGAQLPQKVPSQVKLQSHNQPQSQHPIIHGQQHNHQGNGHPHGVAPMIPHIPPPVVPKTSLQGPSQTSSHGLAQAQAPPHGPSQVPQVPPQVPLQGPMQQAPPTPSSMSSPISQPSPLPPRSMQQQQHQVYGHGYAPPNHASASYYASNSSISLTPSAPMFADNENQFQEQESSEPRATSSDYEGSSLPDRYSSPIMHNRVAEIVNNEVYNSSSENLSPSVENRQLDIRASESPMSYASSSIEAASSKSGPVGEPDARSMKSVAVPSVDKQEEDLSQKLGTNSAYVQRLRVDAGETHVSKLPAFLPLGIRGGHDVKVRVNPEFLRKVMDIKYTHLPQRMIATEVDDDDDDDLLSAMRGPPMARLPMSKPAVAVEKEIARPSSPVESVIEPLGKIKLFVANPDDL